MLPFPQVVCPMEEDASTPCAPLCTPLHSATQPHLQSPPFVKCSHSYNDGEKKKSVRRSGRLQVVKEQEQGRRQESRKSAQKRGTLASSQRSKQISGNMKSYSRRSAQSGITMHKSGRTSRCNVNQVTTVLKVEDCATGKSEVHLDAKEPEKELDISEPPESPPPAKRWVFGPLLQSVKTKMACFTEMVMSPVRLFRPNTSSPSSPEGSNLSLNSVQERYSSSDTQNGQFSEGKKESDHVKIENKEEDNQSCFASQEVKRESDTEALDIPGFKFNQGNGTSIDGIRQKCFRKRSAAQRLNFDTETEVKMSSVEQGSISLEQNVGFAVLPKADEQQDCHTYPQDISRTEKEQQTNTQFYPEHNPLLHTRPQLGSVSCGSDSISSPQDSQKGKQQSSSPFSSNTKQQTELLLRLQRLSSKHACQYDDIPLDCPPKHSPVCAADSRSTAKSKNDQILSEEKPNFCDVYLRHCSSLTSESPTVEPNVSVVSDPLTSLYYTPPNSLSTSAEIKETDCGQLGYLEKVVEVRSSNTSILCNVGGECTNSMSSPSKCSATVADLCQGISVQVLADHEEILGKQDDCDDSQSKTASCPESCHLQEEYTSSVLDKEEAEKKTTEARPRGIHADVEDQNLQGRGGIVVKKRRGNVVKELMFTSTRETRRDTRPYQVRRGRSRTDNPHLLNQNPDKCKYMGAAVRTIQDTETALLSEVRRAGRGAVKHKLSKKKHSNSSVVNSSTNVKNGTSGNSNPVNTSISKAKSSSKTLNSNVHPHTANNTLLLKLEPVVMITKLSPHFSTPGIINTAEEMHKDEGKMVRTITPGTLNEEVGHQVPKQSQNCRLRKKNVRRDTEMGSSAYFNNELAVQDSFESSPKRCGSVQKVSKESKGEYSRVLRNWQGVERPKRTRNRNCVIKAQYIGPQKVEEKFKREKFEVDLTQEGSKKAYNETSAQVEPERDVRLCQQWAARSRDAAKDFLQPDDDSRSLGLLKMVKMPSKDFTQLTDIVSCHTLNSFSHSVTIPSPDTAESGDGSTCCIKTSDQSGPQAVTVSLQMVDHLRHPVCSGEHTTKQTGSQEECLREKPDQKAQTSVLSSSPASADMQKFAARKVIDMAMREEAEPGNMCKPNGCRLVTEQGEWKAKHREMPSKALSHRKRSRSWVRNEGWGKDSVGDTREQQKGAIPPKTSGNGPLPTRLLRSNSCPEISALLDNSWSRFPSSLHSSLPSSVHQCPQVCTHSLAARRTRRHTVCSLEVEREIAPLCLRKEVYPTGGRGLYCSPASISSPSSCISLTALASLFLSSPLAFLSQSSAGTSGGGGSINCDDVPSSCDATTPSSSTSPDSSSFHALFHGSSAGISPRSDQCSASVSSVCSKSSEVPLEHKRGKRHQQEENRSFHVELASKESREEKSLSDSEIKIESTKQGEYGKVSRIRIRKTPPKPLTNLTPMGLPRPVRLKKKEFSLEEIYTNKNFRKPPEGRLETIFEVPVSGRDGSLSLISQRRFKRLVEFPEAGVARKPKRPLVGLGLCRKVGENSAVGRTRRAGNSQAKEGHSLTSQELDSLLCSKLSQLDRWISLDQVGVLA